MKSLVALLPVLIAFQAGAPPALAWTWPVDGPVLRPFALGDNPYAAGQHRGIDVAAARGSPVRAPTTGTVSFAGTVPGGGRTVTLLTGDGHAVTLVHLGEIAVVRDAPVEEGAVVGTIGPSGDPEHAIGYVHLGVRAADDPNGYLDPLAFLPSREVAPPSAPEPAGDPAPSEEPVQPLAPVAAPATVTAPPPLAPAEVPAAPFALPATPDEPAVVPDDAAPSEPGRRPTVHAVAARAVGERNHTDASPARPPTSRPATPSGAEAAAVPGLGARPARRPVERVALLPERGRQLTAGPDSSAVRQGAGEEASGLSAGTVALAGALAALVALAAALARLRRGQLGDAGPADAAPPVLADATGGPAEDAGRPRTAEDDRLIPNRDLEWIALRESEALADLDRDHDPAQLVEVPDDARRRPTTPVVAASRSQRARRHQSSRCRMSERVVAR
jgi:Peptidase family M23